MLLLGLALTSTGIMDNGKIYLLRLVIAHFGDLADVGLYTAGVAVANQYIGMVLMSMASDYSPRLAAVSDDNVTFIDAINKQMKLLVTLVTPLIIFFILFIKPITILLYSTKFIPITGMLEWMMLGMTFLFCGLVYNFLLCCQRRCEVLLLERGRFNIIFCSFCSLRIYIRWIRRYGSRLLFNVCLICHPAFNN